MSGTFIRLGLWTLVLILALFVVKETYADSTAAEWIPMPMLQQALAVAILLVVAGIVTRMLEKTKKVVVKNRCSVCGKTVPSGAIYCREHLRNVLDIEDRRTHSTRIR